jgi:hypothetical protein
MAHCWLLYAPHAPSLLTIRYSLASAFVVLEMLSRLGALCSVERPRAPPQSLVLEVYLKASIAMWQVNADGSMTICHDHSRLHIERDSQRTVHRDCQQPADRDFCQLHQGNKRFRLSHFRLLKREAQHGSAIGPIREKCRNDSRSADLETIVKVCMKPRITTYPTR